MNPLHDKDLDRLSRDAAEHYEVDFGPSGWEQLEKRLDQELPQQRGRRRFLFWLFFIVVTTGGALAGLLINSQPVRPLASNARAIAPVQQAPDGLNSSTESKSQSNNTIADNGTAGSTIDKPDTKAGTPPADATTKTILAPLNREQATTEGTSVQPAPATQLESSNSNKPVPVTGKNKTGQPQNKAGVRGTSGNNNTWAAPITAAPFGLNRLSGRKNNLAKKPTVINDKNGQRITRTRSMEPNNDLAVIPDQQGINQDVAKEQTPVTAANQEPVTTPNSNEPANQAITGKNKPATDSVATPAPVVKPKKDKKNQQRGFEFGVVGGPDGTTVQSGPMYKSGYNVGLQIGYRFSDRWSVNTGVIYTKKYYKTDTSNFDPKGNWYRYIKILSDVKGSCSMFDIPLNLRYDVSFNDKRRLFVNTGLSTYYMDKQNYAYRYRYLTSMQDTSHVSNITEDESYPFSVFNLSVGYERNISQTLSLQVEPYLKIPLKELGYGYMRMNSYGVFFSLKYRPAFGSKRPTLKK
jgi:hypothetical protein